MLNASDVYVSGGSNNLLACWTDKVTKYDASSFYNWEQDNLPLHDLDERTHLLWEKFGHPTSALTGMSFVVSAGAGSSCNPLFFDNLSSCIDALPEVINCPILVEVVSFGNLGGLNLSNKSFGPNGALEIINRNSAFAFPRSLSSTADQLNKYEIDTDFTDYTLASAVTPAGIIFLSQSAGTAAPTPASDHIRAKCLTKTDSNKFIYVASGTNSGDWTKDVRFRNPYVFVKRVDDRYDNRLTASLSSTTLPWDVTGSFSDAVKLEFEPFDKTGMDGVYDVSTLNHLTNTEEAWGHAFNPVGNGHLYAVMSFSYFNSLDYIKVNECNGPVYIRNFNVDGQFQTDRGIEIKNSKVNLERTSVSRCNRAGLYADNSEVNILRGIVCYRNYENTNSVRVGVPFAEKRVAYKTQKVYGAGIFANNSTVNFKDTYDRDIEKSIEASGSQEYNGYNILRNSLSTLYGDPNVVSSVPAPSRESLTCFSRNDIGIHAVNSTIIGGRTELGGSSAGGIAGWQDATDIQSELNTEAGIRLENSVLDYNGRILVEGNYFGLDSYNSKISLDSLAARFNQSTGLKLKDSDLIYNKNTYAPYIYTNATSVTSFKESQLCFIRNEQAIVSDNSRLGPVYTSSMPSIYNMVYAIGCFGIENRDNQGTTLLPCIEGTNNSYLDLIHTHVDRTGLSDDLSNDLNATFGAMVRSSNNSKVACRGSGSRANVFLGPSTRGKALKMNAVYAADQSTVYIQGPTVVAQVGVDLLAENESKIDLGPHRDSEGSLLLSAFDLSSQGENHTMVELHSTRSCIVANNNSNLNIKDLGSYTLTYEDSPSVSSRDDTYDYTYDDIQEVCTSNGWIQLYPNGNLVDADVPDGVTLPTATNNFRYRFQSDGSPVTNYRYLVTFNSLNTDASNVTTGGMAVRCLGDSVAEVTNVHFPCGWANCSGIAYDFDGTPPLNGPICSRLHIWNVADQSLLKASYVSVSGLHPVDVPYNGPSGTWGVSAAPSTTPDTSSLSILDYYGVNNDSIYGKSSIENRGPFRLYFSVDPASRFLVSQDSNLSGLIYQIFSQGYNWSGAASAADNADYGGSANYTSLLKKDDNGNLIASGYYYASAILSNPNSILVSIDDSAANAFANAKHNTVGKSGLGKVAEVYYPMKGFGGDSDSESQYGAGLLSVNNFDLKKDN